MQLIAFDDNSADMTLVASEYDHSAFHGSYTGGPYDGVHSSAGFYGNVKLLPKGYHSIKSEGRDIPPQRPAYYGNPLVRKIPPLIPLRLRPRRERPCDQCRHRKTRCVAIEGYHNLCTYCQAHGTSCTFVQPPTPRKRRQQDTKKDRQDQTPTSARTQAHERTNHLPKREQPTSSHSTPLEVPTQDKTTSFDLPLLDLLDYGQDLRAEKSPFGVVLRNGKDGPRGVSEDLSHEQDPRSPELLNKIRGVVGAAHKRLLELYRDYVHPHYPILSWSCFYNQVSRDHQDLCPALLACVYLVALDWWSHTPNTFSLPKPNAQKLLELAFESLLSPKQPKAFCTVQARLLLLLIPECRSWEDSCATVSLAQELNLHRNCSTWGLPLEVCQLRKQIAWAVFLQDKWNAWVYGRPSHIQKDDWSVPMLMLDDFKEFKDTIFSGCGRNIHDDLAYESHHHFILLIQLTETLSDVLQTLYTETATKGRLSKQRSVLEKVSDNIGHLQNKVHRIAARIPPLSAAEKLSHAPFVTSIASLRLAYNTVDIQLHRLLITVMSEPLSLAEQKLPAAFLSEPKLYESTRLEAKLKLVAALEFVNRLSPATHLRDTFWHSFAPDAFASMVSFTGLLMATAPTQEEAAFFSARIKELGWTVNAGRNSSWVLAQAVEAERKVSETLRKLKTKQNFAEVRELVHKQAAKNEQAQQPTEPMAPIQERSEDSMDIDTDSVEGDDEDEDESSVQGSDKHNTARSSGHNSYTS